MKKIFIKALSLVLAGAFAATVTPFTYAEELSVSEEVSAEVVSVPISEKYEFVIDGAGDVVGAYYKALGAATDFYSYNCESGGVNQAIYTVYTDPVKGGYMKGVTLGNGYGQRGRVSKLAVEADGDERLLAGVNADFYSIQTGVPLGIFVEDGRFVSSSDGHYAIGFDDEGKAFLGKPDDKITLVFGEKELEIAYLNKFATIFGAYLITEDFGNTVRDTVESEEYILSLSDELRLGKSVECEVLEKRRGTADGNIPDGCAVLIIPDEFMYRDDYIFEVGDKFEIKAEAEEGFVGAKNAIGGGDIILSEGNISENINDEVLETSRNPRTAMGITEDGRLVFTVVDGRQTPYSSGVNMISLAKIMASLGCVSAINLDGGGSSVMVLFDTGKGVIVNSPSDKSERAVPNGLTVYESRLATENLHYIDVSQPSKTLLSGSVYPLEMTLKTADGSGLDFEFTPENTVITFDEALGSVEFREDGFYFTAGECNGVGKLKIETVVGEETVCADVFVGLTDRIDRLQADKNIILSDADEERKISIQAFFGNNPVYYGELLSVSSNSSELVVALEGENVYISVNPQLLGTEEVSVSGTVSVSLLDKELEVPVYFDDSLSLMLDELLASSLYVSCDGYTVEYIPDGGVIGGGAFAVKSPSVPEPEPIPEPEIDLESENIEPEELFEDTEALGEAAHEPEKTEAEEEILTEPEVTEKEPEESIAYEEPTEPFNVELSGGKLVSDGFSGRTVWMWVDGLAFGSEPYAVFETEDAVGRTKEHKVYYDMFYDFTGYNGKALLKLKIDVGESNIRLKTILGYTAFEEEQCVFAGPIMLLDEYNTNLYYDTADHWSSYYVNSLSYMGIISGSEDLKGRLVYMPDSGLTREQFAKILVNYLKIDIEKYSDTELDFADMDEIASWAVPYVKAAVGEGLMKGRTTPQDTLVFAPTDGIKRQEAIYVLGGLLELEEGIELSFTDSEAVAAWARENIGKALAAGIISGYDDGSIRPEGGITRGEAATLMVRLYNFSSKS